MSRAKSRRNNEVSPTSPLVTYLRILIFGSVVIVCLGAGVLLYIQWQDVRLVNSPVLGGAANDLSPVEAAYLSVYLASKADELNRPVGVGGTPLTVVVDPGQSADQIAQLLVEQGLEIDPELFIRYVRYHGLDGDLEAGTFEIESGLTLPQLALTLTDARAKELDLRFIEGWRLEEMANYLRQVRPANIDAQEFQALVERRQPMDLNGYSFLASLPEQSTLEGFLFPDTYRVPIEADATLLVRLMLENFDRQVTPTMRQAFGVQGLSVYEAVTLASIVQREAVVANERPVMVGVFLNRLVDQSLLQADPTVQYALGWQPDKATWWKTPLSAADLQVDSPYNTYRYAGLPPGPIANPGLAAIEAVASPVASDYLFFVVDCTAEIAGSHVFSTSYEEHLSHVQRCRE